MGSTLLQDAADAGKAFIYCSGKQALLAAGNFRVLFRNPANSGKMIRVAKLEVASSAGAMAFSTLMEGPSASIPTGNSGVTAYNMHRDSSRQPAGQVFCDTSLTALSGGLRREVIAIPPNDIRRLEDMWIAVPPGMDFGINTGFAGLADTCFTMHTIEE